MNVNQTWETETFETNIGTFEYRLTGFRGDYTLGQIRQKGTEEWFDAHWASEVGPTGFELGVDIEEECGPADCSVSFRCTTEILPA